MSGLQVFLFGKFGVQCGQRTLTNLDTSKTRELLSYLLFYRDRPHPREVLAALLWSDSSVTQSKGYLRKALWHIQTALDAQTDLVNRRLFLVEPDWVQLNPEMELWLDVAVFERTFALVEGLRGRELDSQSIQTLQSVVQVYRGDLLEDCYQDWCIYERERLQHMYLAMLDKLMDHCEAQQDYELGLSYGMRILRYDRARERTHRRIMRLYCLAGDRTAALRQYERCVAALDEELDVRPSKRTMALYEQIRADQLDRSPLPPTEALATSETGTLPLLEALDRLKQLTEVLVDIQYQVQQSIQAVDQALTRMD